MSLRELARACVAGVTLLSIAFVNSAMAQSTNGRLIVTVKDQNGAVIPNANIKVTNQGTAQELTGATNGSGIATFDQLGVGLYTVTIDARAGDRSLGAAMTFPDQIIPNQNRVTDLGTVTLAIDGL